MRQSALPQDPEDRERAIQIVGSATRRLANAIAMYLIFALPSLGMAVVMFVMQFGDFHPMDPAEPDGQFRKLSELVLTILAVCLPNLVLIWMMFRVQTKSWWRRLIVQSYFRRALQIVVGIRVVSWLLFMFVDGLIGMLSIAMIAIPAERFLGDGWDLASVGIFISVLPIVIISAHLLVWGTLTIITSAITSSVMTQTTFPCLWCGHEQNPTVGDRCPECGIVLSDEEVSRAKARGIYQPMMGSASAADHLENPTPDA